MIIMRASMSLTQSPYWGCVVLRNSDMPDTEVYIYKLDPCGYLKIAEGNVESFSQLSGAYR